MGKRKPEKKTVSMRLNLPSEIHKRLKVAAAMREATIADTAIQLLDKHLPKVK